jgi:hypothetical protein
MVTGMSSKRGDELTLSGAGVTGHGRVHCADQLQVLLKWEYGGSSSLGLATAGFRSIRDPTPNSDEPSPARLGDPVLALELDHKSVAVANRQTDATFRTCTS